MQISGKEIYTGRGNIDTCHTARKIKGQRVPALIMYNMYGSYMTYMSNVKALRLHHAAHTTHARIASGHWSLFLLLGNDTLGGEEHASD